MQEFCKLQKALANRRTAFAQRRVRRARWLSARSRQRLDLEIPWPGARCSAPESTYRGPQQVLPGSPTRISLRWPAASCSTPRKQAENTPPRAPFYPSRGVPGSPTRITGVPNKYHRGARQILPGSPTKTAGVPNKYYRGPRQKLPGSPTRDRLKKCCKTGFSVRRFLAPLFLFTL